MVLALALATLIGLSLGLMGGGGSILTVPILVYVLKMDAKISIALSLAIVGATSLIGAYSHYKKGNVNVKVALIFGVVAMLGTNIGVELSVFMSGSTQLIIFAFVMLVASFFMFRGQKGLGNEQEEAEPEKMPIMLIVLEGIAVGVLTGIVGVGGGFLIVPALVLLGKVPMKKAVGTSLLVISMKSLSGFVGYIPKVDVPWDFLGIFVIFTAMGIIVGSRLVQYVSQQQLKKGFAIFLVVMGLFILYKNRAQLGVVAQSTKSETQVISQVNWPFSF
jgi:uncharacterized membrane protein YfcA